jgi:molybdate transport system substrate-binding protein
MNSKRSSPILALGLGILLCLALPARAESVVVAVATNLAAPMKVIAQDFERDTGHTALLSFGATGNFYAQIRNGAPYGVFLAADDETPAKLEQEGYAVAGSRFTYAQGRLVLWSKNPKLVDAKGEILSLSRFERIAIANPKLAPYGRAAIEVITRLGLISAIRPKIVEGANIGQAFQFVASENAALGFVAMSQIIVGGKITEGSAWIVPGTMHTPIRQDVILLNTGKMNAAALSLMAYLKGEKTKMTLRAFGYGVP